MIKLTDTNLLRTRAYIDGQWVGADSGKTFDVTNPATGNVITAVPDMGVDETRCAIDAASSAWPAWRSTTAGERAAILHRWHDLMVEHVDDLAVLMTSEQGKPVAEARGEIHYAAAFYQWYAEEAKRIYGDVIPSHARNVRNIVIKQPIGVVGMITPWNFPTAMMAKKASAAIAAGCPVVWKPASETPLSGLAMAELAHRAGVPAGVFNVVTSRRASVIGGELTANPTVRKFSFTGSTEVGKILMRQCADTIKKVSLELGGNAPFLVFDDADLDAAVAGAIASKYRNAGQTCVCANRIFVQDGVYEPFSEQLAAAVQRLQVGPGLDEGVAIGPLINEAALEKVESIVADARAKGASVLTGGKRHELGHSFYEATVLTNVTDEMACTRDEIFGPVAPISRFKTEEEAIARANNTPYGLAAYFYTQDAGRIWRVAEALEYGMVGINTGMISTAVAPFGGVKQSGLGREGSKYGIEEYLEVKFMCLGGIEG